MKIIIDSREQKPYDLMDSKKSALKTGDYTVEGYEEDIAVERKAYSDLYSCLTSDLKRFKKQLKRLSKFKYKYLLIDSTVSSILLGHPQCKLPGKVALNRLLELGTKYDIPICFVDNKGALVLRNLLKGFLECLNK